MSQDAAAAVIIRLGYAKTTVSDIAEEAAARAQMEQIKQAKDTKQTIRQGATDDNG